ncbi:MAG TPA: ATP-binding protein, partial [Balneolales bacterium]|nr:ATP-binding protein [Balneolales bacterium]
DGSRPDAMTYVHKSIKRHIKIVAYDTNRFIISKPPPSAVGRPPSGILIECLSRTHAKDPTEKSVKSLNPCPSVIQTIFDIVEAHEIELKLETKKGAGSTFIIHLPA